MLSVGFYSGLDEERLPIFYTVTDSTTDLANTEHVSNR